MTCELLEDRSAGHLAYPEGSGNGLRHEPGIRKRVKLHEPHPVLVALHDPRSHRKSQAGLARAPGPVSVSSRLAASRRPTSAISRSRPTSVLSLRGRLSSCWLTPAPSTPSNEPSTVQEWTRLLDRRRVVHRPLSLRSPRAGPAIIASVALGPPFDRTGGGTSRSARRPRLRRWATCRNCEGTYLSR